MTGDADKLAADLTAAGARAAELKAEWRAVGAQRDQLILELVDAGWSHRQIAARARVAYPRVSQLVALRRAQA